jgi:hypothetical protein
MRWTGAFHWAELPPPRIWNFLTGRAKGDCRSLRLKSEGTFVQATANRLDANKLLVSPAV